MEVVEVAGEDGLAPEQPSKHDECGIDERESQHEECGCDLPSGVNRKGTEEEAIEHGSGVSEDNFGALRQAQGKWEIEEGAPCRACGKNECENRNLWLIHPRGQREQAKGNATNGREEVYLPRNPIEPVEGVRGEDDPEDGEHAAPEGKWTEEIRVHVDHVELDQAAERVRDRVNPGTRYEDQESDQNLKPQPERPGKTFQVIEEGNEAEERDGESKTEILLVEIGENEEQDEKRYDGNRADGVGEAGFALQMIFLRMVEEA